ncbi:MAG: type I-D CRISPR-associated protein Cas7/Csc2 [Desulfurococcaceae archaeon]
MEQGKTPVDVKLFYRAPTEPNRIFAKSTVIEVIYAVVSKGIPLFRTEGVGDVTLLDIYSGKNPVSVPAILPEKIQAKLRRQILAILRGRFNDKIKEEIKKYKELGFTKVGEDGSWNCYVAPPKGERETDIGMCGFCPACNILGTILTNKELTDVSTSYGVKSRVVHDIAFGTTRYEKAVADFTHNKVGDGVSYTGVSLFNEPHVLPGVVFIGKLAMYDVTEREAKLVLSALSSIHRMGGGETKYGSLQVLLIGVKSGNIETISSYDIARRVLEKYDGNPMPPEDAIKEIVNYISSRGFAMFVEEIDNKKVDEIDTAIELKDEEIEELWRTDNYYYAKSITDYIKRVEEKTSAKSKGKGRKKERKELKEEY